MWWYFSYRNQKTSVGQPNFIGPIAGTSFDTKLWNPSGKVTYQINQNSKLIGYYQWGQKEQPNRLPQAALNYTALDGTLKQISGSWIYKGEWNGTINKNMFAEARYGVFGYYFPLLANSDVTTAPRDLQQPEHDAELSGADQKEQTDRRRLQATGSLTYFKDGWGGTHNFKVGGEMLFEYGWYGYTQVASGKSRRCDDRHQRAARRASSQFYAPTALKVGSLGDGPSGNLLSIDRVNTKDFFITDQFSLGRATLNLGVRYDGYDVFTPDQTQLAYNFPTGVSIAAASCATSPAFCKTDYVKWNSIVPRLGIGLRSDGGYRQDRAESSTTGCTASTRRALAVRVERQPQPAGQEHHLLVESRGRSGYGLLHRSDHRDELTRLNAITSSALAGAISVDPNIKQPLSHQATAYIEQQLTEGVGLRTGFVYYSVKNQVGTVGFQPNRPASAYTVPFSVVDPGPDGIAGNAVDQSLTAYGIPSSLLTGCTADARRRRLATCAYPANQVNHEPGGQRHLQDLRGLAQQAPESQLLARRGLWLHLAARLPVRLPEHAERAG